MKKMFRAKWILGVIISAIAIAGCDKDPSTCKNVDPSQEDAQLTAFNTANSITATKHTSGMYYQILAPGGSAKPTYNSRVYVKYKGTLLDGTVFDQQTNPGNTGFVLSSLIQAWQLGIPMLGRGGSMKMTVPSSLGYGCKGSGASIPPNTPLYFEIELVDFL
jgi:FKBP-type peptidyl-prolyl cis-trans isomerase FkpA